MTDRMKALEDALQVFVDEIVVPDRDCSCHLAPPCNWCVEHSYMAEAVGNARALLADKARRCAVCDQSPADCECHMPTIPSAPVTRIISDAPVQVCPICDIEGCRHIREAASQPAAPASVSPSSMLEMITDLVMAHIRFEGNLATWDFRNVTGMGEDAILRKMLRFDITKNPHQAAREYMLEQIGLLGTPAIRQCAPAHISLRITGPNSDGEYWLHLKNGNGPESAGINLGGERRGMIVSALLKAAAGGAA